MNREQENVDVVQRFYRSMDAQDPAALLSTLAGDVVGHVSEGLPVIGGVRRGSARMLQEVWIPAHRTYGVCPDPEEFWTTTEGHVVVRGTYRGEPPDGQPFTAAFVHIFRLDESRIVELHQVTDTATWLAARPATTAPEDTRDHSDGDENDRDESTEEGSTS